MNVSRWGQVLGWLALAAITRAQVVPPPSQPSPPPFAQTPATPASRFSGSSGSASGDAAAALAAGELTRADILYRAAYQMGDRNAGTLAARAQLALWQNKLIEAETLAKAIDLQTPEAAIAAEVLQSVAARRNEDLAETYGRPAGASATVKFLKRDPLPFLVTMIGGRAAGLIVDTGSDQLQIADSFARVLGLTSKPSPPAKSPTDKKVAGPPQSLLANMDFGSMRLTSVPVTILPAKRFAAFSPAADGVIGMAFLSHFLTTIDYPRGQITLAPRNARAQPPAAAAVLPLWRVGEHRLYVEAAIANAEPRLWLIDTGRTGVGVRIFDRAYLESAGVVPAPEPGKKGPRSRDSGSLGVNLPELRLGEAEVYNLPAELVQAETPGAPLPFAVAGVLSHEFFKRWSVTLDLDKMQLVLASP